MPFCPSCEEEFQESVAICPACNTPLVAQIAKQVSTEDMVDVYECYDVQLAERVQELLREGGVNPLLRDYASLAFPTNVGTTGAMIIAVAAHELEASRNLIRAAIEDGVLETSEGELM